MRLGIRAKQIAGVTAIVGMSVVLLSGLAATMVASLVMNESLARGKLIALSIYQSAREVVSTSSDPYAGLREDRGLRVVELYAASDDLAPVSEHEWRIELKPKGGVI